MLTFVVPPQPPPIDPLGAGSYAAPAMWDDQEWASPTPCHIEWVIRRIAELLPVERLVRFHLPTATVTDGRIDAEVLLADRFGNLQLAATVADLSAAGLTAGARLEVQARPAVCCEAFAEIPPGEFGVLPDAFGRLQLAVNQGSAARLLGRVAGQVVAITSKPP